MAAEIERRIGEHVRTLAEKDVGAFTALSMRGIRQRVGEAMGQDLSDKPQKAMVKAAVGAVLASALFQQPEEGAESARRESDANVFTQPTSPGTGAAGGATAQPTAAVGATYRCVKKAVLRESADLSSAKCGTLHPGETIAVLETSEVAGSNAGLLQRVRCERGWTSILSSSGNLLLEAVSPGTAVDPSSAVTGEDSVGSTADASPKERSHTSNADTSPDVLPKDGGTGAARKRKRLSLGLSEEEEEEEEDEPEEDVGRAATTAPHEVEWVQCEQDGCGKWRRLTAHVKASDLPERFVCKMNHWDTSRASCDAPEEPEHNEQATDEGSEVDSTNDNNVVSAVRRGSLRNRSVGRLTDAQRKAVALLKNRDTLSTIAALGDEDDDDDEGLEQSVDEVEHVESDFIQAKAAKKRPVSATGDESVETEERGDKAEENLGPAQTVSKKARRAAAEKQSSIFCDDAMEERRLAARRALPYSQRLLVEDDEARLRKVLAVEAKKGDPAGKVARGLARLQVHASVADPNLLAAAQKCVTTAARREGLAAEAARLEKKGELREALQQYQLAAEGLDMSLKPGLAKHLKELEQKVFDMSWAPHSHQKGDGGNGSSATTAHKQTGDVDLPQFVQRQLKDLKFEAVTLKKAGDREGAKDKLRQMNDLRVKTRRAAAAAAAAESAEQEKSISGDIDWESAAGAIDFDSLYKQRKEEKVVVDEFGVDLATLERLEQEALAKVPTAISPPQSTKSKARMMF